ncbi:MAG: GntR family transcriptional regulator [Prevotellaceae bacterium]|jgi:DNA-binding transcriptional regulator YhcF (GntR family)|nr:GntR family transcriptional regulator [Prevotellaceae bacterium]
MEFTENKAIYIQIADFIEDKVLSGEWLPDERIPSVRDLAASLSVNYNTIIRAYEWLQQKGVVYEKRGLGHFVALEAPQKLIVERRQEFVSVVLPSVFKKMALLDFSIAELNVYYKKNEKR